MRNVLLQTFFSNIIFVQTFFFSISFPVFFLFGLNVAIALLKYFTNLNVCQELQLLEPFCLSFSGFYSFVSFMKLIDF